MKRLNLILAAVALILFSVCIGVARGQGIGSGKQPIDIWASVYGTNTAATISNVIDQVDGRSISIGIDNGAWLVDRDLTIPTNISIYVKRGSYFLLTNSATIRFMGDLEAGNHLVFGLAAAGGNCLVDGDGGVFPYVYSNWFGAGVAHTNMASVLTTEVVDLDGSIGWLRDSASTINMNFTSISQDFRNVQAYLLGGTNITYALVCQTNASGLATNCWLQPTWTNIYSSSPYGTNPALVPQLQRNQDIARTNFMGVNTNTTLTTNLFNVIGDLLGVSANTNDVGDGSGRTVAAAYAEWVASFKTMNTNLTALPTNLFLGFPSIFTSGLLKPVMDERARQFAFAATASYSSTSVFFKAGTSHAYHSITGYPSVKLSSSIYQTNYYAPHGTITLPSDGWYLFNVRTCWLTCTNGTLRSYLAKYSGADISEVSTLSLFGDPDGPNERIEVSAWCGYATAGSKWGVAVYSSQEDFTTNANVGPLIRAVSFQVLRVNDTRNAIYGF